MSIKAGYIILSLITIYLLIAAYPEIKSSLIMTYEDLAKNYFHEILLF